MLYLERFLHFWYDFVIGDDWTIAVGVVIGLALTAVLVQRGLNDWWLMPLVVAIVLALSLWREVSKPNSKP